MTIVYTNAPPGFLAKLWVTGSAVLLLLNPTHQTSACVIVFTVLYMYVM